MKDSPRLRLEPSPSRIGRAAIAAECAVASVVLAALELPIYGYVACAGAVLAVLASGLWRVSGGGVPAILHVGVDRRITVTGRDGRSRDGAILDDSYVGACLTSIVWRPDDEPWWRPARAVLILPDTLPREDFRRLRVALRYGIPGTGDATSGVDARRPASHA